MFPGLVCVTVLAANLQPWAVPPGAKQPWPLADGKLRTMNGIAFTRDGRTLYTGLGVAERDARGRPRARLMVQSYRAGTWTAPEPLAINSRFNDYQPVLAPGEKRLYFNSTRPLPGESEERPHQIWVADRSGDRWGEPRPLPVGAGSNASYPAITAGGTLLFTSNRPGGLGGRDIWTSRNTRGEWSQPVLVTELSSPDDENDVWIDPRGRLVILNRYHASSREIAVFASRRTDGRWSSPQPLDAVNRPKAWELTPCVSPDGKYFLFTLDGVIHSMELRRALAR